MPIRFHPSLWLVLAAGFSSGTPRAAPAPEPDAAYLADLQATRMAREERLRAEEGWLSLVGLFWLDEGENSFGADPAARVVLPEGTGPARAGVFTREGKTVTLRLAEGVEATVNGDPFRSGVLSPDTAETPSKLRLGRISCLVIERGERLGIRMRDPESPARRSFRGCDWFPARPELRIEGRFERYDPPRPLAIPNVLGDVSQESCPGAAVFVVNGVECRLEPTVDDEATGDLFFVFGDRTNGETTYPGGRFLTARAPVDGRIVLDFNRAVSPPCAFTAFATCPLPPAVNQLPIEIAAGERFDGEHP